MHTDNMYERKIINPDDWPWSLFVDKKKDGLRFVSITCK